jgi:uncharacterized protein
VRVLLDANVLVSALISRVGAPARLLELWLEGAFDLVVSEQLLGEVERALAYPKVRQKVAAADAAGFLRLLRDAAEIAPDTEEAPPARAVDPNDDYLLALAARERVPLVSADSHLLGLGERLPILSPRQFVEHAERG